MQRRSSVSALHNWPGLRCLRCWTCPYGKVLLVGAITGKHFSSWSHNESRNDGYVISCLSQKIWRSCIDRKQLSVMFPLDKSFAFVA